MDALMKSEIYFFFFLNLFLIDRWQEVSGSHQSCNCCDTDCGTGNQSLGTETGKHVHSKPRSERTKITCNTLECT